MATAALCDSPFCCPCARHGVDKGLLNLAGLLDCVTAEHTLAIEGDEVAINRGAGKADEPAGGLRMRGATASNEAIGNRHRAARRCWQPCLHGFLSLTPGASPFLNSTPAASRASFKTASDAARTPFAASTAPLWSATPAHGRRGLGRGGDSRHARRYDARRQVQGSRASH